jgi:hypothetical protein
MALSHNPRIVTKGLVLALDAANPKSYPGSGTTWFDMSGNGHHATINNAPAWNSNGWFEFRNVVGDAVHTYMSTTIDDGILQNGTESGSWSLDLWYCDRGTVSTSESMLVARSGHHSGILQTSSQVRMQIRTVNGATGQISQVSTTIDNSWYHVVMTWANRRATMYVNGVEVSTQTMLDTDFIWTHSTAMFIGGMNNDNYRSYADIGITRAYNRALTADEIKQNFEATRSRFGI